MLPLARHQCTIHCESSSEVHAAELAEAGAADHCDIPGREYKASMMELCFLLCNI